MIRDIGSKVYNTWILEMKRFLLEVITTGFLKTFMMMCNDPHDSNVCITRCDSKRGANDLSLTLSTFIINMSDMVPSQASLAVGLFDECELITERFALIYGSNERGINNNSKEKWNFWVTDCWIKEEFIQQWEKDGIWKRKNDGQQTNRCSKTNERPLSKGPRKRAVAPWIIPMSLSSFISMKCFFFFSFKKKNWRKRKMAVLLRNATSMEKCCFKCLSNKRKTIRKYYSVRALWIFCSRNQNPGRCFLLFFR